MRLPWKRTAREAGTRDSACQASAFEHLALPLLPSLYNVAFWLSRNAADAEDLVQETFLKALRGFASFEPGTNFRAWIFRILRNTYLTSTAGLAARRTVSLEDELGHREWKQSGPSQRATIPKPPSIAKRRKPTCCTWPTAQHSTQPWKRCLRHTLRSYFSATWRR